MLLKAFITVSCTLQMILSGWKQISASIRTGLFSAAAEAEIVRETHDGFIRIPCLTSAVCKSITVVVVKRAHDFSIRCGFALSSIDRNFRIAVSKRALRTNLAAAFGISGIPNHHLVLTATTSSCRGASSARRSSRHVERLPP